MDDVGFEKVKFNWARPPVLRFPVLGSVAVILGASGSKLDDLNPGFNSLVNSLR